MMYNDSLFIFLSQFVAIPLPNEYQTESTLSIWKSLFYNMAKQSSMINVLINAANHGCSAK